MSAGLDFLFRGVMTEVVGLRDALIGQIDGRAGAAVARPGTDGDAVDGVVPAVVAEPASPEAAAGVLGWASEHGRSVVVRGGGTKLGWGAPAGTIDVLLSTRRLDAVEAHRHGDLTATVQAGAALADVNAALAAHRQWLPLDARLRRPRHHRRHRRRERQRAAAAAPRRPARPHHRHDPGPGRTAPSRRVAASWWKNVAGYDLARLLTGSFGSLGVILNATFKLAPMAEASRTVRVTLSEPADIGRVAAALPAQGSTPTAVELAWPPAAMLVRFESSAAVAGRQAERAAALVRDGGGAADVLAEADEAEAWRRHESRVFGGEETVIKLVVLPSDLSATLTWLDEASRRHALDCEVIGRAGLGVLYVRLAGSVPAQASLVDALRDRIDAGRGSAVVRRAEGELRSLVDVWGSLGDAFSLMERVKRQFDPRGILNPGRGPGGL